MTDLSNTIITTERLRLIPISEKYAQDIFQEFTEEVTTYMFPRSPKRIEDTLEFIRPAMMKMARGEELQVVILLKETGEYLGGGGIHGLITDTPELGIWIKQSAHGHKYGREAVTALKKWVDKNIPYKYIKYPVDKRNIPSRKIAESLGGIVEAEYKKENMAGNILDDVEYRIYKT